MLLLLSYIKEELNFISYPTFQIASSKVVYQKRKSCAIAISLFINLTRIYKEHNQNLNALNSSVIKHPQWACYILAITAV